MSKNFFSELENLGFKDLNDIDIYKKKDSDNLNKKNNKELNKKSLLYEKELICPVCKNKFKAKAVKTSAARMEGKDSDFFIRYYIINPYFYDVWLCNNCGYATMKKDFKNIKSYEIDLIKKHITSKWKGRKYPDLYDLDTAIERYKISLLNYVVMESKSSKKAMNCLKIAWMYRLKNDYEKELHFLKQALEGFNYTFQYESSNNIYGMNKFTLMYLIGELNRRIGNDDIALQWFSKVVTSLGINSRLKEMARDQRDLIKEKQKSSNNTEDFSIDVTENFEKKVNLKNNKKGFFSKLFNK
jgi:uncharacterized protein (DUF2225 family)